MGLGKCREDSKDLRSYNLALNDIDLLFMTRFHPVWRLVGFFTLDWHGFWFILYKGHGYRGCFTYTVSVLK